MKLHIITSVAIPLLISTSLIDAAMINFTADTSSSLIGNFEFDLVIDGAGAGQTIANFPHFHLDIDSPPAPFLPGDAQFFISVPDPNFIILSAQDLGSPVESAIESYPLGVTPITFADRSGTFLSPYDASSTISYSYTNVSVSSAGNVTGNFAFSAVPEPGSTSLLAIGSSALLLRRRRR